MPRIRPDFMNSPYFVDEPGNWHLKEGAPEEMQREFRNYMDTLEQDHEKPASIHGIHIDFPFDR